MTKEVSVIAQDDGLAHDDVGAWVEDKHRLLALYDALFSTGMKKKWEARVYVDLYSGSGLARIRDTGKFLWGSPIIALSVRDPFDKYIFCESNRESLSALKERVGKLFPDANVEFVHGDCNFVVEEISRHIPVPSKSFKVLSFCFVDPYDLSIRFSTLRGLAERHFVDFLCLLALEMDAGRNLENYVDQRNTKIDEFLGLPSWRTRWMERSRKENTKFPRFLAEEYAGQMQTLGFLPVAFEKMKQVRSDVKNLPLYRLALFSRHPLAYEY